MKLSIFLVVIASFSLIYQGCDSSSSVSLPFTKKVSNIKGEVFLVTKGGQSIKLGDTPIHLQTIDAMNQWLSTANEKASSLQATLKERQELLNKVLAALSDMEPQVRKAMAAYERQDIEEQRRTWPSVKQFLDESSKLKYNRDVLQEEIGKIETRVLRLYDFNDIPSPVATSRTGADGAFSLSVEPQKVYVVTAEAQRGTSDEGQEKYFWMMRVIGQPQEQKVVLSNSNVLRKDAFFTRVVLRP